MALETATYISGLVNTNPVGASDPVSQGDDHIRLIKSTLLNSFPGVTGAVTATHTELNYIDGATGVTGTGNTVRSASPTLTGTVTAAAITASGAVATGALTAASLALTADLPVTEGGTGASTAEDARTNLGVAIGSDVQAYDADLAAIAALDKTDGNVIVGNGSAWVAESGATARTSLGLGTGDSPQFTGIELGHASDNTLTAASGQLLVEGKAALQHAGAYTSGAITFGTSAAADGDNGDIHFTYTA